MIRPRNQIATYVSKSSNQIATYVSKSSNLIASDKIKYKVICLIFILNKKTRVTQKFQKSTFCTTILFMLNCND